MEVYQILEGVSSDWDNGVILSDGRGNEYIQEIVTFNSSSNSRSVGATELTATNQPQLYYLDANNTMVPIMETMDGFTLVTEMDPLDPDGETPPHVLDHMYAKKPREPGTEQIKPIRRRSKKKDQTISHVYVEELIPDAPKINIIRQRRPVSQSLLTSNSKRPKILQGNQMATATLSANMDTQEIFNAGKSSFVTMATTMNPSLEYHLNLLPSDQTLPQTNKRSGGGTVYDDCEIPQPGEMVTVADVVQGGKGAGGGQRRIVTKSNSMATSMPVLHGDSVCIVSNLQNFGGEDSLSTVTMFEEEKLKIENVVPEEELFFDMIEESDHLFPVGMNVDIDDVEMGNSIIVTSSRNSSFNYDEMDAKSVMTQVRKRRQTAMPPPSIQVPHQFSQQPIDVLVYPPSVTATLEHEKELGEDEDAGQQHEVNVKSEILSPPKALPVRKNVSWKLVSSETLANVEQSNFEDQSSTCEVYTLNTVNTNLSSEGSPEVLTANVPFILKTVPAATRRSTRPIKLPARLEDHESVISKRQRR